MQRKQDGYWDQLHVSLLAAQYIWKYRLLKYKYGYKSLILDMF